MSHFAESMKSDQIAWRRAELKNQIRGRQIAGEYDHVLPWEDWAGLFPGQAVFFTFTHQNWINWVSQNGEETWGDWLAHVMGRYGLS